jgi:predicted MPP superfamily phosphohydrolase
MKNGLPVSVVLAPGGTTMFWVRQAVWAGGAWADGVWAWLAAASDAAIHVPARTVSAGFMFLPVSGSLLERALMESMSGRRRAVNPMRPMLAGTNSRHPRADPTRQIKLAGRSLRTPAVPLKQLSPRTIVRRTPIFHLIFSLPYLLVITRFVWPLQLPLAAKCVAALLLLVASQYHLWCRLSSGSVFSPEFPRPLVILFNWAFGAIILLALLQLLLDGATLLAMLVHGGALSVPDGVRYAMAGIASVLAAIGVLHAVRVPPLLDIEIVIAGLPSQFDGYMVLQLTDLHISRLFPARWTRAVVTRANDLGANLIVVTGDLIDGTLAARRKDVEPLRDLQAADGVYVIPGNHEYFFGYRAWMAHYAALGMRLLQNDHVALERDGGKLVLAGVTDLSAAHTGHPARDLAAALTDAPAGAPVILLDHQPRQARQAAALGVALQLSGHTHGGMVLGLDRLAARANAGYVSGRYDVDGMTLYVSNGTALWPGFALRLGRPSELTRITLREAHAN